MAEKLIKTETLQAIADAIKAKEETTDLIPVDEYASRIRALNVGGSTGGGSADDIVINNQDLTITENGTYTADSGYTGLGTVTVEVASGGGGDFVALIDGSLTEIHDSTLTRLRKYAIYRHETLQSVDFQNVTELGTQSLYYCRKLTRANFPNATVIGTEAFYYCEKLASINAPNVTSIDSIAFKSCMELESVDFPNITQIKNTTFSGCKKLKSVNFPRVKTVDYNAFGDCYELTSADFPVLTSLNGGVFGYCYSLKSVILRSETMCALSNVSAFNKCHHILGTVDSTYNPNGDKDGYFYVPRALLSDDDATKDYRRATNWSTFATQFRALEDYTVDGTITGDLDPTKI
jgi:hypothetical protein